VWGEEIVDVHKFQRKYVFRLDNKDSTLGDTSFKETLDRSNQGGIHVETSRDWNIENWSISKAREPANE